MKKDNYRVLHIDNRITALIAALLAAVLIIAGYSAITYAEGSDNNLASGQGTAGGAYEVTSFDMHAVIGKDHTYDVEETITVNIPSDVQKIEFAIPSGSFRIRGVEVEGITSSANISSQGSTVSIADAQALTAGIHTYVIRYKIFEFADRNDARDLLYFNILMPEWKQPIGELRAVVEFPEDFPIDGLQYFAGQFGVQDAQNRLTYDVNDDEHTLTVTGSRIPENFGITLEEELADGYWEGALDGIWAVFMMMFIMGAAVFILLIMWIIGGRDPRIRRVPQSKPIEGLSPVELGYVFNSRFDGRDLVRMIIYFAIRGYLRISEYEPKRYRLYRLEDPDGEEKLLRNAYSVLFEDVYKGRALDMDDIGERLLRIEHTIRDDVAAGFSARDMQAYTPLSRAFRIAGIVITGIGAASVNILRYSYQYISINYAESILIGLAAALLTALLCKAVDRRDSTSGDTGRMLVMAAAAAVIVFSAYFALIIIRSTGHILAGLLSAGLMGVCIFLTVIMRARGRGNSVLMMRLRQLRRFIAHPTPKEILDNYLEDPGYYYDMMIYALTFGSEESWAISFLTLDVPAPEWYTDETEGHAFSNLIDQPTTVNYARDVRAFVRTVEQAYDELRRRRRNGR